MKKIFILILNLLVALPVVAMDTPNSVMQTPIRGHNESPEAEICTICCGILPEDQNFVVSGRDIFGCDDKHRYCSPCLGNWCESVDSSPERRAPSCPLCRQELDSIVGSEDWSDTDSQAGGGNSSPVEGNSNGENNPVVENFVPNNVEDDSEANLSVNWRNLLNSQNDHAYDLVPERISRNIVSRDPRVSTLAPNGLNIRDGLNDRDPLFMSELRRHLILIREMRRGLQYQPQNGDNSVRSFGDLNQDDQPLYDSQEDSSESSSDSEDWDSRIQELGRRMDAYSSDDEDPNLIESLSGQSSILRPVRRRAQR